MTESAFEFFDIGPGFVRHWVHETSHWKIESKLRYATRGVLQAFDRLLAKKNLVRDARRQVVLGAVAAEDETHCPENQAFFDATHDFYQTYYSTLSAFVSLVSRFSDHLPGVPHSGNEKFLSWLEDRAIGGETAMSYLREAREFRTFLDHPAQHQPYDWLPVELDNGSITIALHGPSSFSGKIPAHTSPIDSMRPLTGTFPDTSSWAFLAPDENQVLTYLSVQLNAIFPRLNYLLTEIEELKRCRWQLELGPDDPPAGYPVFASIPGTVVLKTRQFQAGSSFGLFRQSSRPK